MRFPIFLCFILGFCLNAQAAENGQNRAAFARTVKDMVTWDFAQTSQNPNWVIAQVTSVPSHWETVAEPRTKWDGKTPLPDNTSVIWVGQGTVRVLTPLTAAAKKTLWPFRFERRGTTFGQLVGMGMPATGTEAKEIYSPFYHQPSGVVLCSVPDSTEGEDTAKPPSQGVYLLSEDTRRWVVPAMTFHQAHPDLFSADKVVDNVGQLLELTENENPFLAAAAFRTLARAGRIESSFLTKHLVPAQPPTERQPDRFRQALFLFSLFLYSPPEQGKVWVEKVQQVVNAATDSRQIEGLAIGAYLAYGALQDSERQPMPDVRLRRRIAPWPTLLAPQAQPASSSLSLSSLVLRTLLEKQKQLGVRSETERYVFSMVTTFPAIAPEYTRSVNKGDRVEFTRIGP